MPTIISIRNLNKVYASGQQALNNINLEIQRGEIFALLGPNGAGKTTLINIICGLVTQNDGTITVDGHDIQSEFRAARSKIGLVPQELPIAAFEKVINTVNFSRGLFGKPRNPSYIEKVLRDLSLWDKKEAMIMTLSGGMKRRVLIAKAICHEPQILFLDEPTAGVDIELRREMWDLVRRLCDSGVTIILTTHYLEEAEEMADRIGIMNNGKLVMVEEKKELMHKLGNKQLRFNLQKPLNTLPLALQQQPLELTENGRLLIYTYDTRKEETGISVLLSQLAEHRIEFNDLHSTQSSLEEIFVNLVKE